MKISAQAKIPLFFFQEKLGFPARPFDADTWNHVALGQGNEASPRALVSGVVVFDLSNHVTDDGFSA